MLRSSVCYPQVGGRAGKNNVCRKGDQSFAVFLITDIAISIIARPLIQTFFPDRITKEHFINF